MQEHLGVKHSEKTAQSPKATPCSWSAQELGKVQDKVAPQLAGCFFLKAESFLS